MRLKETTCRGFSLAELLAAMGILAVLAAFGYGAFQASLKKARMTEELAALRRVTQAYLGAAADQEGIYPMGLDEETPLENLDVRFPDGVGLLAKAGHVGVVVQRLPWRLAPYLDWNFDKGYVTWTNRKTLGENPSGYYYTRSIMPAFGLNAYGVGGYRTRGNSPDLFLRVAQVTRPSATVAFAAASMFYVKPPNIRKSVFDTENPGWKAATDNGSFAPERYGNIRFDYDGKTLVSFLDGHTRVMTPGELRDSRLWSRAAQESDDRSHAVMP